MDMRCIGKWLVRFVMFALPVLVALAPVAAAASGPHPK